MRVEAESSEIGGRRVGFALKGAATATGDRAIGTCLGTVGIGVGGRVCLGPKELRLTRTSRVEVEMASVDARIDIETLGVSFALGCALATALAPTAADIQVEDDGIAVGKDSVIGGGLFRAGEHAAFELRGGSGGNGAVSG
jgi:hypothetical protein